MSNNRLIKLYKEYIDIFNTYEIVDDIDYIYLTRIYQNLTDLLVKNKIIERYGIKNYKIVESGEII